jgi:hypothetical protein
MSNGTLVISATDPTVNSRNATRPMPGGHIANGTSCASTIWMIDSDPASIATTAADSTIGSSYAISWAAARSAPISAYLFADDHPAISTPIVETDPTASR